MAARQWEKNVYSDSIAAEVKSNHEVIKYRMQNPRNVTKMSVASRHECTNVYIHVYKCTYYTRSFLDLFIGGSGYEISTV